MSRVTTLREDTKKSYDRISRWYDLLIGRGEKKFREAGLEKLDVREGEKVLEIGFGTGHCILAMARSTGSKGKVYGIDISGGMLKIASLRIEKAGMSGRVDLQLGDAANLPYQGDLFDAIFISFALELFDTPDIPVVLRECQRVLKEGGRICIVAMSGQDKKSIMLRLYEWGHRKFPKYIDCRPIFAARSLEDTYLKISDLTVMSFIGIPVDIILARKKSMDNE